MLQSFKSFKSFGSRALKPCLAPRSYSCFSIKCNVTLISQNRLGCLILEEKKKEREKKRWLKELVKIISLNTKILEKIIHLSFKSYIFGGKELTVCKSILFFQYAPEYVSCCYFFFSPSFTPPNSPLSDSFIKNWNIYFIRLYLSNSLMPHLMI